MGVAIPLVMLATTAISAAGAVQQGIASQDAANYRAQIARNNAQIASDNARVATQAGERASTVSQLKTAGMIGGQKAAFAAGGFDVNQGTPLDVKDSTASIGALDAMTIRNNAARQALGYQTQAQSDREQSALDKVEGANDMRAGVLGGAKSILGGASSYAQNFGGFGSSSGNDLDGSPDAGDLRSPTSAWF